MSLAWSSPRLIPSSGLSRTNAASAASAVGRLATVIVTTGEALEEALGMEFADDQLNRATFSSVDAIVRAVGASERVG